MTSKKEQFYIQRIAELEEQLKQHDKRIAALEKQVAELIKVNAELADKVAKLSKNSSNSSKPPSSGLIAKALPLASFYLSVLFVGVEIVMVTIRHFPFALPIRRYCPGSMFKAAVIVLPRREKASGTMTSSK